MTTAVVMILAQHKYKLSGKRCCVHISWVRVFLSKLKKLIRYIRSKQGAFQEEERQKKLQRYETDHFLEPFAGLTPEYMEMSQYHSVNERTNQMLPYSVAELSGKVRGHTHKVLLSCFVECVCPQSSSLALSRCSWRPSPWPRSSLCSTTSLRYDWMPRSLWLSCEGRWQREPKTLVGSTEHPVALTQTEPEHGTHKHLYNAMFRSSDTHFPSLLKQCWFVCLCLQVYGTTY